MADGKVYLTGYMEVPLERIAAVTAALPHHIALTRAEPGCIAFSVTPSLDDPTRFTVAETFRDQASFDAYQRRTASSAWARITEGLPRHYTITTD